MFTSYVHEPACVIVAQLEFYSFFIVKSWFITSSYSSWKGNDTLKEIRYRMDCELAVEGFSEENIRKFCYNFFGDESDALLHRAIFQLRIPYSLLRVPTNLLMFCIFYEDLKVLPTAQIELSRTFSELMTDNDVKLLPSDSIQVFHKVTEVAVNRARMKMKTFGCRTSEMLPHVEDMLFTIGQLSLEALQRREHRLRKVVTSSISLPNASEGWGKVLFSICQFTPQRGVSTPSGQRGVEGTLCSPWGYPHPSRLGGIPSFLTGYPHLLDQGGTPFQSQQGYPHPVPTVGYPIWQTRGYPIWLTRGYPILLGDTLGYPLGLDGVPLGKDWMVYPHQDWMGYLLYGLDGVPLPLSLSRVWTTEQALAMWWAVCLLCSHRRTFLFFSKLCLLSKLDNCFYHLHMKYEGR